MSMSSEHTFELEVVRREMVADDVVEIELAPPAGSDLQLPTWDPGAHIDLDLRPGLTRQFSLVGGGDARSSWKIAILREQEGRGGSHYVHEKLVEGTLVAVRGPRNHFPLRESNQYLFIAGGIGITPMIAMIETVARTGADWSLVYGGRNAASMAYRSQLVDRFGARVSVHPQDEVGLLDLGVVLGGLQAGCLVYCCGPESLLSAVEERLSGYPDEVLQVERFAPKVEHLRGPDHAFEVEIASTGEVIEVPPDQTLLHALEKIGIELEFSCAEGTCGTCETGVLEGSVDHRDSILSKSERAKNDTMMPCVSRSTGGRLVLDL